MRSTQKSRKRRETLPIKTKKTKMVQLKWLISTLKNEAKNNKAQKDGITNKKLSRWWLKEMD